MPRRPSKKSKGSKPRSLKRSDAKLTRWETADDIPLDEEDVFHGSRDKVLLDGDEYGGDSDGDDDEVFALKGLENDEDKDEVNDVEDYEDEGAEDLHLTKTSRSKKKDKKEKKGRQRSLEDEEEEEEEVWGKGKAAYYSSNAAQLESDDEEGQELEEQEARRLQRKALDGMTEDDFGLNDRHEISRTGGAPEETVEAPNVVSSLPHDKRSLLRHLEKTNPEALALARDWDDTVQGLMKTRRKIAQLESTEPDKLSAGMAHLHYQALLTYATTLAFYLHLRASPKYARRPELLTSHPIMLRLLTLKQSVSTLEDLGFTLSDSEPEFDEDDDESLDLTDEEDNMEGLWRVDGKKGLEPGELDDLLQDAQMSVSFVEPKPRATKPQTPENKPPKKKRKLASESSRATTTPIFDLEEPEFTSSKKTSRPKANAELDDAYGEATRLQLTDAADKSARKKSLRFHTSKIESTSARRQGARNQAMGGDDDIPYRERQKEKEARLLREAKNRVQNQGGEELDDTEPPERTSEKRRRGDDSDAEDVFDEPDGYYELVKKKSKENREQKKAEYDTARAAERQVFQLAMVEEESLDGPRSLTRAILTNKGLTPHRPKAVRNPRVKKRQKFEKAKKKLSSQKAVYKGGLSQTGGYYEGEKSGISKVVKSVKLG
ncbi:hypothetical protein D9756_004767 [Leucocoprinus leucothites]|uniref:Sas10 C-terminal domain-containing protein n=1 Tax=Leucocoprinus leucothites TaxID=201217 RepID=A0A8H5LKG1_9AGAR|nr:hypothetical protein D9756_004767 [Leucoagaricus leucothites]